MRFHPLERLDFALSASRFPLFFHIKNSPFFAMEKFNERNLTKLFPMLNVSPLLKMRNSFIYGFAGVKCGQD